MAMVQFVLCDPIAGQKLLDAIGPEDIATIRTMVASVLTASAMVQEALEAAVPLERREEFEDLQPDQRWGAILLLAYQLEIAHQDDFGVIFEMGLHHLRAVLNAADSNEPPQ